MSVYRQKQKHRAADARTRLRKLQNLRLLTSPSVCSVPIYRAIDLKAHRSMLGLPCRNLTDLQSGVYTHALAHSQSVYWPIHTVCSLANSQSAHWPICTVCPLAHSHSQEVRSFASRDCHDASFSARHACCRNRPHSQDRASASTRTVWSGRYNIKKLI